MLCRLTQITSCKFTLPKVFYSMRLSLESALKIHLKVKASVKGRPFPNRFSDILKVSEGQPLATRIL